MHTKTVFVMIILLLTLVQPVYSQDTSNVPLWSYETDGAVYGVSISSDGSYIAAGSDNNNVYFFNRNGGLLWSYKTGSWVESVSISSDGSYIAA
ncbi:MAG: PQQ-binding-like beta-propeller repeat protein [Halobacteriota archaeon]|nr:PQQ-binding-like beta-propeller repeat protein [Halobacteriota archaeon]